MGAERNPVVKVDDVLVEQANAAGRNGVADALRLVGAVQAEEGVVAIAVEIKRAGAERIVDAAVEPAGVRLVARHGRDHVGGGRPMRPLFLAADDGAAAELRALAATDADAV